MAIEQDRRDGGRYHPSPEQESAVKMRGIAWYGADARTTVRMEEFAEPIQAIGRPKRFNPEDPTDMAGRNELVENLYEGMADAPICFGLLVEIHGLKPSGLRRVTGHKVWRMKRKMEAQGERF